MKVFLSFEDVDVDDAVKLLAVVGAATVTATKPAGRKRRTAKEIAADKEKAILDAVEDGGLELIPGGVDDGVPDTKVPANDPAPDTADVTLELTEDDVRVALSALNEAKGLKVAKGVLKDFHAERITDVDVKDYNDFVEACEKAAAMSEHSPLGASQYERWGACPGSVALCKDIESVSTIYAAEGTVAHEVAADILLGKMATPPGTKRWCDGFEIEVTQEMLDYVQEYVDLINSEVKDVGGNMLCQTSVEQSFELKSLHPDLWGRSDFTAYYPDFGLLRVYDFKYGAGVPVEVKDNKQEKYYALGALLGLETKKDKHVSRVELIICQPRCPHEDGTVRRDSFDAIDLIDFEADLLRAVKQTEKKDAPLIPGEHCRWCSASPTCPELNKKALALSKIEFGDSKTNISRLSKVLEFLPIMETWVKNVRAAAYAELKAGKPIPGWKLVAKRATRHWTADAEAWLLEKLSEEHVYVERKLKSPAQIEKGLKEWTGNKSIKTDMKDYVAKISSGTTMAPASDKRQEVIEGPKADFQQPTEDIFQ